MSVLIKGDEHRAAIKTLQAHAKRECWSRQKTKSMVGILKSLPPAKALEMTDKIVRNKA